MVTICQRSSLVHIHWHQLYFSPPLVNVLSHQLLSMKKMKSSLLEPLTQWTVTKFSPFMGNEGDTLLAFMERLNGTLSMFQLYNQHISVSFAAACLQWWKYQLEFYPAFNMLEFNELTHVNYHNASFNFAKHLASICLFCSLNLFWSINFQKVSSTQHGWFWRRQAPACFSHNRSSWWKPHEVSGRRGCRRWAGPGGDLDDADEADDDVDDKVRPFRWIVGRRRCSQAIWSILGFWRRHRRRQHRKGAHWRETSWWCKPPLLSPSSI